MRHLFLTLAFAAAGGILSAQQPPILIAFDLNNQADIDEAVPHTKLSEIHPQVLLQEGLKLGLLQTDPGKPMPGTVSRGSVTAWVFHGAGNGTGVDDTEASSLQAAIDNQLYITFTIAPAAGYALDLSNASLMIDYAFVNGGRQAGPTHSAILTSVTGFSEAQTVAISQDLHNQKANYELAHPGLRSVTGPIEIRIYYWRPDGRATFNSGASIRQAGMIPGALTGANIVLTGSVGPTRR